MVDFVGAIATATQAVKLSNDLRGVDKAFESAESKLKIAELNGALADLKNALIDAKEEVRNKQSEFTRIRTTFSRYGDKQGHGRTQAWLLPAKDYFEPSGPDGSFSLARVSLNSRIASAVSVSPSAHRVARSPVRLNATAPT
jgi:hypothetical protein